MTTSTIINFYIFIVFYIYNNGADIWSLGGSEREVEWSRDIDVPPTITTAHYVGVKSTLISTFP